MIMLSEPDTAAAVECPYIPGRFFIQDYFFAMDLDEYDYGVLLNAGWRRFGKFFFRPDCTGCRMCIPIRIDAQSLSPSSSQRRVISRGKNIRLEAVPPAVSDEAWRVYRNHSEGQFGREADRKDFEKTFYDNVVPSLQTEYRLEDKLIGLGFLDISEEGMSSVYFAFDPEWAKYSTGILSVFRESELVRLSGPHQLYDWEIKQWVTAEEHPAVR